MLLPGQTTPAGREPSQVGFRWMSREHQDAHQKHCSDFFGRRWANDMTPLRKEYPLGHFGIRQGGMETLQAPARATRWLAGRQVIQVISRWSAATTFKCVVVLESIFAPFWAKVDQKVTWSMLSVQKKPYFFEKSSQRLSATYSIHRVKPQL